MELRIMLMEHSLGKPGKLMGYQALKSVTSALALILFTLSVMSCSRTYVDPRIVLDPQSELNDGDTVNISAGEELFETETGATAYSFQCANSKADLLIAVCGPVGSTETNFDGSFDGSLVVERTFNAGTVLADCGDNTDCWIVVVVESAAGEAIDIASAPIDFATPDTDVVVPQLGADTLLGLSRAEQLNRCDAATAGVEPTVEEIEVKEWAVETLQEVSPADIGGAPFESFAITLDYLECSSGDVNGRAYSLNSAGAIASLRDRVDGCHITLYRNLSRPATSPVAETTVIHESAHCWQAFVQRAGGSGLDYKLGWFTEGFANWYAAELARFADPGDFFAYPAWRDGVMLTNDGALELTELSGLYRSDYDASGFWTGYKSHVGGTEELIGAYESALLAATTLPPYVGLTASNPRDLAVDERSAALLALLDRIEPFSLSLSVAKAIDAPGPVFGRGFVWPDGGVSESQFNWVIGEPGSWSSPLSSTIYLGAGELLAAPLGTWEPESVWELEVIPSDTLEAVVITDIDMAEPILLDSAGQKWTYAEGLDPSCPVGTELSSSAGIPVQVASGTPDFAILANPSGRMVSAETTWRGGSLDDWQEENCYVPAFELVEEVAYTHVFYDTGPARNRVTCGTVAGPLCRAVQTHALSESVAAPGSGEERGTRGGSGRNSLLMTASQAIVEASATSTASVNPGFSFVSMDTVSDRRSTIRVEAGQEIRFSWDVCSADTFPANQAATVSVSGRLVIVASNTGEADPCSGDRTLTFGGTVLVTLGIWARAQVVADHQSSSASASRAATLSARL